MTHPATEKSKKNPWYMRADAPPYVPQPKGTPWYAINWGATILLLMLPLWFGVVQLFGYLNNSPDQSELVTLNARIVNTYRLTPHLLVRLSDGKLKSMEFPVSPSMMGGGRAYYGWRENNEAKDLIGCDVQIQGTPMRWTPEDRFRVWKLDCPAQNIHLGELSQERRKLWAALEGDFYIFSVIWLMGPVLIFILVLRRERKAHA